MHVENKGADQSAYPRRIELSLAESFDVLASVCSLSRLDRVLLGQKQRRQVVLCRGPINNQ